MMQRSKSRMLILVLAVIVVLEIIFLFISRNISDKNSRTYLNAQNVLTTKQKELRNLEKQESKKIIQDGINSENSKTNASAKEIVLDENITSRVTQLANVLFNYKDSNEFLNREKKLNQLVSTTAFYNHELFPTGKTNVEQLKSQNIKSQLKSVNMYSGVINKTNTTDKTKVLMVVHYQMYLDDRKTLAPTDVYELEFEKDTNKFTSIKKIGGISTSDKEF